MKATLLTSAIAFCALTAFAADHQTAQQQRTAPAEKQAASQVTQVTLSVAAPVAATDSPLVAAAKRSNRLNKKSSTTVITNDTLAKSGGHFTTTKTQEELPPSNAAAAGKPGASDAPLTTPAAPPAPAAAPAKTEAAKAADNKANASAAKRAVADYMGESAESIHDDPATQEGVVRQTTTPQAASAPKPVTSPAAAKPPSQ